MADATALARLFDDPRVLASADADQPAHLQAYVRASDLPALVDAHGLHAAPSRLARTILLRPVSNAPFVYGKPGVARLVQAIDLLELTAEGRSVDTAHPRAAWELIEQRAAQNVPSWYRATRPPRRGPDSRIAIVAPKRALRSPAPTPATDADLLAAMLFAVGQPVRREDLLEASGWTPARLQAAVDQLLAEPPRGQQVMVDDDRLQLVAARAASSLVQRLFEHLQRCSALSEMATLRN